MQVQEMGWPPDHGAEARQDKRGHLKQQKEFRCKLPSLPCFHSLRRNPDTTLNGHPRARAEFHPTDPAAWAGSLLLLPPGHLM